MADASEILYANLLKGEAQRNYVALLYARDKPKPQPKAEVGTVATRSDATPAKSKKPQGDLGKQQIIAVAGDTIPIVFGKRANSIGGIWAQPALVKTSSTSFVGGFLYAISQGSIVSSPVKHYAWLGTQAINTLSNAASITLTHYYESSATMEAAKNVCPITSGKVFCDYDAYSYRKGEVYGGTAETRFVFDDFASYYRNFKSIVRGEGDTSNSLIVFQNSGYRYYDNKTGADVTASYWAYYGVNPANTQTAANGIYVSGVLVGCKTVGTITYLDNSNDTIYTAPDPTYFTRWGATGPITTIAPAGTVNNQAIPANPASTGTLYGAEYEIALSSYINPASPPGNVDFTTFADITFLQIYGNIYDEPDGAKYPTTTRQISIFYESGITVDLYSGGLVGGVYTTGASNQFVDLAMYLFTLMKRADGATTSSIASPIDVSNLQSLATFCTTVGLFFNGIIEESVNTIEYISKTAPFFLLSFISSGGRYSLQPLLPINASNGIKVTALTPAITFTEDDILPGSFQKQYDDADERRAVNVSLIWREADPISIGIQRTISIRYSTTASDAPVVQFDMTDFCTTAAHATIFGKYELARRKFSTHVIAFATPLLTTSLIPTQIIKIERQRISSRGDNRSEIEWYQVTNVKHNSSGITTIQAAHFPVDGSDIAKISNEVVNGTFQVVG